MKTKGNVVDSTGMQRFYCPECGQLRVSARLGEVRSLQPFVTPLDGELPELIFVLERKKLVGITELIPQIDIVMEEYVLMKNLSAETKEKIRKELRINPEPGELSNRVAKWQKEENENED